MFASTPKARLSIPRLSGSFEIIAEALSQIAKLDPPLAQRIPDLRQIVAFRNLLIHGCRGGA
jgi:hypothetical protein